MNHLNLTTFFYSIDSIQSQGSSGREASYEDECHNNDDAENLGKKAPSELGRNVAESQDFIQDLSAENSWEVMEENGVGSKSMDHDVLLAVSMMKLHSAQEAIEKEVQKLKDIGKEDPLFLADSIQTSEPSNLEGDLKTELEEILKQRIEVEVQYTAISEAIQQSKARYIDQIELMVQQKKLTLEHMEVMNKLECAESKARELNREAEKLKVTCEEIMEREQILKVQNRVCRLTSCFTIQLILFILVVYLYLLRFSSLHRKLVLLPT